MVSNHLIQQQQNAHGIVHTNAEIKEISPWAGYTGFVNASDRRCKVWLVPHLGSNVRETEISDVATTSTLTSLSLKTLNTCTATT